jgi:hypothetical protein
LNNKKYTYTKAFTVQELLIGMVISAIIIGMTYTIYAQINKQLYVYQQNQDEIMEFNQFRQVFSKDIALCQYFKLLNNRELCLVFSNGNYAYRFENSQVVREREEGIKDTFKLSVAQLVVKEEIGTISKHQTVQVHTSLLQEKIELFESKKEPIAITINNLFVDGN